MTDSATIKPKQAKHKKYMLVGYGRMNTLGWFEHHETDIPKMPSRVVVKTNRGLEMGHVVGQLCPYREGQFKLSPGQLKRYFDGSEIDIVVEEAGKFIRYATADDISEENHLRKIAEEELRCCRRFVKELGMEMKIVDAEHIFGGERLIFYFMSDGRVDFRDLVKKVARERQTRIEMRQIGSRDEAKLLGDIESCGQECCCIRFLKALKPVNMRMAKMQKATLDPSKISGYCGRLKCCLRYEDQTYTELKRKLPKRNAIVRTKQGRGRVIDAQILTQLVVIEMEDGTKIAVPVDELETNAPAGAERNRQNNTQNDNGRDDKESEKQ
ncbi:MAG: regulatory iron-sulfur-containing complex subunit RicT [Phycisphaerae bacterium]|jgi:cell fate regulator YaaT (PSP1 superfamily)